jgi:cyanophycin synthetase
VLNADDEHCLKMADHTRAKNICYVTMNIGHPLVKEHIRAGGRAVVLEEGINGHMITLFDKGAHIPLLWTHLVPATLEGRAIHNVQNAMFAAGMAFSMGAKLEDIRHGLRTFDTTFFQVPGRMNIFNEHPFKVILDYGHNPAAVHAMCTLVDRLDVKGRRLLVLAAPGDRRDEDVQEIARIAAGRFDHYICRRDDTLRGRDGDEIPRMLAATLQEAGVPASQIETIPEEERAVAAALRMAQPGDQLLIFADELTRSWKQIVNFTSDGAKAAHEPRPDGRALKPMSDGESEDVGAALVTTDASRVLESGAELIRDERGVRLARESND